MKPNKKSTNKLSEMEVLKDLRALFSSEESVKPSPAPPVEKPTQSSDGLAKQLQTTIEKLKTENSELIQRLESASVGNSKANSEVIIEDLQAALEQLTIEKSELLQRLESASVPAYREAPNDEIVQQLEDRKAQLSEALSKIEDLLRLNTNQLMRKLANVVSSGGFEDMGVELRRGAKSLESAEYFGYLLRMLLDE